MASDLTLASLLRLDESGLPQFDPSKLEQYSEQQLTVIAERIRSVTRGLGGTVKEGETPAQFAERVSRGEWVAAKHLKLLSDLLSKERFLTVSMPPRAGKTELLKWYVLYRLAKDPSTRLIYISFSATRAEYVSYEIRKFVELHGPDLRVALDPKKNAINDWQTTEGGGLFASGLVGFMGRGADVIIVDDPISAEIGATSEIDRERQWHGFHSGAMTRLHKDTQVIVVMTRWHYDDLIGRIERDTNLPFRVLRIPAKAEPGDELGREPGEYLEVGNRRKNALDDDHWRLAEATQPPWIWNALFQQNPVASGSGQVQREWWRYYDQQAPLDLDQQIQSWDLAVKEHGKSYSVGQVWGRKGINCFLLAQFRAHCSIIDVMKQIRAWHLQFPLAKYKYVEEKAAGPTLLQLLQKEIPGLVGNDPGTHSKEQRLEAVVPMIAGGNVWLPAFQNAEGQLVPPRWVWEYVEEFALFPKGVNDDQVDATTQALAKLMPQTWKQVKVEEPVDDFRTFHRKLMRRHLEKWRKPTASNRYWKSV